MTCREIPLFQKTCWTNCSKGTNSKYICLMGTKTDVVLHNRLYTPSIHSYIHPMRSTIYISWKVHTSISNTEKTKYSHLDLETLMIMWRPWYWETMKQETEYEHSKKRTEKSIWYTALRDREVICNSLEEEEEGERTQSPQREKKCA